jgi:hypothetical protein
LKTYPITGDYGIALPAAWVAPAALARLTEGQLLQHDPARRRRYRHRLAFDTDQHGNACANARRLA